MSKFLKGFLLLVFLLFSRGAFSRSTLTEDSLFGLLFNEIVQNKKVTEQTFFLVQLSSLKGSQDKLYENNQLPLKIIIDQVIKNDPNIVQAIQPILTIVGTPVPHTKITSLPPFPKPISTNNFYGAGVLPISIHPATKKAVALLGCEINNSKYSFEGFTDFGGKADRGETAQQTAFREFMEETGLFFFEDLTGKKLNFSNLSKKSAQEKAIDAKSLKSSITVINNTGNKKGYVTTVLPVTYAPSTTISKHVREISQRWGGHFAEKTDFAWVNLEDLISHLNNNTPMSVNGQSVYWRFFGGTTFPLVGLRGNQKAFPNEIVDYLNAIIKFLET